MAMATNKRQIPQEFDGKLLARTCLILGRELEPAEKSKARKQFRDYHKSKLRKKGPLAVASAATGSKPA